MEKVTKGTKVQELNRGGDDTVNEQRIEFVTRTVQMPKAETGKARQRRRRCDVDLSAFWGGVYGQMGMGDDTSG